MCYNIIVSFFKESGQDVLVPHFNKSFPQKTLFLVIRFFSQKSKTNHIKSKSASLEIVAQRILQNSEYMSDMELIFRKAEGVFNFTKHRLRFLLIRRDLCFCNQTNKFKLKIILIIKFSS